MNYNFLPMYEETRRKEVKGDDDYMHMKRERQEGEVVTQILQIKSFELQKII